MRLSRYMDEQTMGRKIIKAASAGKQAMRDKATILYDKIPNLKLETNTLAGSIDDFIRQEDAIIEPRAQQMITLIKRRVLDEGGIPHNIGYQELRKLHSKIGKNYRVANSGVNPNLEDARQLFKLQEFVDDAMKQVEKE